MQWPQRSTARGASEIIFMLADTLVSLDHDMATIKPGIASSWTTSPDGKTYTFKLRNDVSFCDGKKLTAQDVVYTIKRWIDPATRSPVAWRAGNKDRFLSAPFNAPRRRLDETRAARSPILKWERGEPLPQAAE